MFHQHVNQVLCVSVLLVCSSFAVAQPAKADPAGEKAKPGVEPAIVLKLVPSSVSVQASANYDEAGQEMDYQNASFELGFIVKPEPGIHAKAITRLMLTKAVTDAGEDLVPFESEGVQKELNVPSDLAVIPGRESDSEPLQTSFHLAIPTRVAKKIATIEGTADVLLRTGPMKRVAVGKVTDVAGKRLKIEGMGEQWMSFAARISTNNRAIKMRCGQELITKLVRVFFFSPDGQLIEASVNETQNPERHNGPATITFNSPGFTEDTRIVVVVCPAAKVVKAKVQAKDVPIIQVISEPDPGNELVMKTDAIEDGFALSDVWPEGKPANPGNNSGPEPAPAPAVVTPEAGDGE